MFGRPPCSRIFDRRRSRHRESAPQLGAGKCDFCLDLLPERMTKALNKASRPIMTGVIADNRFSRAGALQNDSKRYRVLLRKFGTHHREVSDRSDAFLPPFAPLTRSALDDHFVG